MDHSQGRKKVSSSNCQQPFDANRDLVLMRGPAQATSSIVSVDLIHNRATGGACLFCVFVIRR